MSTLSVERVAIGHHAGKVLARDISFALEPGQSLVVLGPNGAGKTTLLRTLLGLQAPLAGEVQLAGRPLARWNRRERARWLAYVPQRRSFEFAFRVLDLVAMGSAPRLAAFAQPGRAEYRLASEALERLGIAQLAQAEEPALSGGEQQLVLLARALVQEARFLLLDEPTANLDLANQARVLAQVAALAKSGLGVLMISHAPAHAFACASHVALLDRQGQFSVGPLTEMLTGPRLSQVYGVTVRVLEVGSLRTCLAEPGTV